MTKNFKPFTLCLSFIDIPQSVRALKRIQEVYKASLLSKKGKGIAILGPSGVGKTAVLDQYARTFVPRTHKPDAIPILVVEVPSSPSPKSLGAAILTAMGDKYADRGSAEEKLKRIVVLLKGLHTEVLILDESQHFVERRRSPNGETTDWLKILLNASKVAVVMAGLKTTEQLFSNEQFRRRFSATFYYNRFNINESASAKNFAELLVSFHKMLPVAALEFWGAEVLLRFHHASYGLIDYLIKIIDRAVCLVHEGDFKEIDLFVLEQAFRDEVWSLAPNARNPFHKEFTFTELIGKSEPFEDFDIKAA